MMKADTRARIEPLLEVLRGYAVLEEVRPAVFHLDGRDFIHFHDEPSGVVADVRLTRGRVRMPIGTDAEQAALLERIDATLLALEDHRGGGRDSHRGGRRRRNDR